MIIRSSVTIHINGQIKEFQKDLLKPWVYFLYGAPC